MNGRGPLHVHNAIISILAGEVFPRPSWSLRWRMRFFELCVQAAAIPAAGPAPDGMFAVERDARRPCPSLRRTTREGDVTDASPSDAGLALLARLRATPATGPMPAYIVPCGESLTYRQLADRAFVLADELRSTISAGSVIILSCPNRLEFPIAFLAILAADCTVFPVSPDAADVELKRAAAESGAVAIIADNSGTGGSPVFPTKNTGGPPVTPGLLLQSSGTTGLPKIVRRSGRSLDAVARG